MRKTDSLYWLLGPFGFSYVSSVYFGYQILKMGSHPSLRRFHMSPLYSKILPYPWRFTTLYVHLFWVSVIILFCTALIIAVNLSRKRGRYENLLPPSGVLRRITSCARRMTPNPEERHTPIVVVRRISGRGDEGI